MISLTRLSKSYLNSKKPVQVLSNINLEIQESEIFGLFGKSGAGKSTLLRMLNGLEQPSSGTVTVLGQDLSTLSKEQLRRLRSEVSIVFQNYHLIYSLNVFKNIALPLEALGLPNEEIQNRVDQLLDLVGISNKKFVKPGLLSGGQRQRVAIARALASYPKILLCDEPTSALDRETGASILDLLVKINQKYGTTVVIISHDEFSVKPRCHRFAYLKEGCLLEGAYVH